MSDSFEEFGNSEWELPLKIIEFDDYGNISRMGFYQEGISPRQLADFISEFQQSRIAALRKMNAVPPDNQE